MWANVPNLITLSRFLLVPLTVWFLLRGDYALALGSFLVAGLSDGLDGFLARRFSQQSELGATLDPLADKALLVSVYVTLTVMTLLPSWLTLIVVTRDVLIVGAVLLANFLQKPVEIRPVYISKVNTFAQIVFALGILACLAMNYKNDALLKFASIGVAALTLGSLAVYMQMWLKHMAQEDVK
jgi:cardiolipin synthase (CMP-forming)